MITLNLFYVLMPVSIYMALMWAPPADILGNAGRILYFHVPLAWVSTLAFIISGIFSIIYLFDKKKKFNLVEHKAYNSASIGMIFMILAIITGSIWSRISWGVYWNWDPRQTSIIIFLLIYVAYFSLEAALADNPARGKLTSSYLVISMAAVPFLIFIIPRAFASLHPDTILNSEYKIKLDDRMKITLLISSISFTFLFFYLLSVVNRISGIAHRIKEKHYENN
jgi:heme exporter protein C